MQCIVLQAKGITLNSLSFVTLQCHLGSQKHQHFVTMEGKFISFKDKIINRIRQLLPGSILFAQDFLADGSSEAVRQQLTRPVEAGLLKRLSQGVYVIPKKHLAETNIKVSRRLASTLPPVATVPLRSGHRLPCPPGLLYSYRRLRRFSEMDCSASM